MPWWVRSNAVCRRALLIGLAVATGCAHSQTDLQDRLSQRVTLAEASAARSSSKDAVNAVRRESKDATVQPAVALQPSERSQALSQTDRKAPLPPAIIPPPRRVDSDQVPPTAVSLPSDSDEAALDAMTAAWQAAAARRGDPARLSTATTVACSARKHRSGPRTAADRIFGILAVVAANYDAGDVQPWGGRQLIRSAEKPQGFNFIPGVGTVPFGFNLGTNFELAELKVQWLLLDFGRRLGRYEQAKLATEIAGLQTERAYQTVANEVAVAYYNVLRSQALRRTAQDALRRTEEELADARKRAARGRHRARSRPAGRGQAAEYLQELITPRPRPSSLPWRG